MDKTNEATNVYKNVLGLVGNTPVVELSNIVKKHNLDGKIYAKLEFFSPGLSKKDRVAKYIIEEAERAGVLKPGQTVIESTSGNTGIGLAMVCAVKGYPFIAVMSDGNTRERRVMIEQFGGQVELVPQHPESKKGRVSGKDLEVVRARFEQLAEELGAFKVGQFVNPQNPLAHYTHTAEEIINDIPSVAAFVDFIGTGGSFEGIAKRMKRHNPAIKCFIIEPTSSNHIIQGGGYLKKIPFAIDSNRDGVIKITDTETLHWKKELASVEGIACGISTGSNLAGAVAYLKENPGSSVVFLVNDTFWNYISLNV